MNARAASSCAGVAVVEAHAPARAREHHGPRPADEARSDDRYRLVPCPHIQSTRRRRSRSSRSAEAAPLMHDAAALQHVGAVGQRQHEIEIMLDDDHGDFAAQLVERLEQLLDDRRRKPFERLVEQEHAHVARQRARDRHHLLLAARQEIRRRVEPRSAGAGRTRGSCRRSMRRRRRRDA